MLGDLSFTGKVEFNDVASHSHVLRAQRSQTVASVLIRVNLAPWTHKTGRQYSEDTGHDALASQILFSQVLPHDSAHLRNGLTKVQQTVEFFLLALLYMVLVVDILPATGSVFADGLEHPTS